VELNQYGVAIGPGDGLVARTGDLVMYLADATGAAALLSALDSAAEAESPWRALAKALAAIALGPDSASIPPFGLVAPADDGLLLILRGHVTADIEADGANRTLAGDRALTWVDEIVRESVDRLVIGGDVSGLTACPHTDLRAGVVPGGGFVVQRVAAVQPTTPSPPAAERIAPETPTEPPFAVDERSEPEIPPPPPAVAVEAEPETRLVMANNGEHGKPVQRQRPAAPSSEKAPVSPGQQLPSPERPTGAPPRTPAPATALASPVIGALKVDDETAYPLDRPYVIGRNPLIETSVRDAHASPIVVLDDPQVSRVHAYVTVNAGVVLVRDAGTPGGTYVAAPGDAAWTKVGDQPSELKPGWSLRIGHQIMVYQTAATAQ
jgi:hypothetical protein